MPSLSVLPAPDPATEARLESPQDKQPPGGGASAGHGTASPPVACRVHTLHEEKGTLLFI